MEQKENKGRKPADHSDPNKVAKDTAPAGQAPVLLNKRQAKAILKLNEAMYKRIRYIAGLNKEGDYTIEIGLQVSAILAGNMLADIEPVAAQRILLTRYADKVLAMRQSFVNDELIRQNEELEKAKKSLEEATDAVEKTKNDKKPTGE